MEVNKCPICEKELSEKISLNYPFTGFLCKDCDLIITDKSGVNLEKINEEVYVLADRIKTYYQREREFKKRYRSFYEYVSKHNGNIKDVLEIGSNIGYMANIFSKMGLNVTSVEINTILLNYQKHVYGLEAYDDLNSLPNNRKYDLIIFMDVIEHIDDFLIYLKNLKKYLNTGGIIFFQFPNKNSYIAKILKQKWNWWCAPDHLYHFSTRACQRFAEKIGMKVKEIRCYSPLLDDLAALPVVGYFPKILNKFNEIFALNVPVYFKGGSLIQLILSDQEKGEKLSDFVVEKSK